LRVALEMKVTCSDEEVAEKLEKVLEPDNRGVPHDQRFLMRRRGKALLFEMVSPRPPSALASVESLLNDINLFREVWLLSS
jgi:hypothetical protein